MIHSQHAQRAPAARRSRSYGDVATIVVGAVLLALAASLLIPRIGILLDDLDYGYPRTMHLAARVGHEDGGPLPTRFIAANLDRQIVVFEIPGGDVAKTRTLMGPYLFGAAEDLTPVRIKLARINGDELLDLVVSIKAEEVVYINENGAFRLINDAERAALEGSDG